MTEKLRLLCVDDDADIRDLIDIAFEDEGDIELRMCASGAEALECAAAYRPALLLLDVMMPGIDGPEALARLRKLPGLESTPVVFVTGQVQPRDVEHFMSLGAVGVIPKPFDPNTLAGRVRELLGRARGD